MLHPDKYQLLPEEFQWLERIFSNTQQENPADVFSIAPPPIRDCPYSTLLRKHDITDFTHRLFFAVAAAAAIYPELFTRVKKKENFETSFVFRQHTGSPFLLPTVETVIRILSGDDIDKRLRNLSLFSQLACFSSPTVLLHSETLPGEPATSMVLCLAPETADYIFLGKKRLPKFSKNFPATLLTTQTDWNDIVLKPATRIQLGHLKTWLSYSKHLLEDFGMNKRFRPGYKALFYGPPGTGKTMTAALIGKESGRDVYRIDLSLVVSKYIGETEKNLSTVFEKLEGSETILFFDEADSLFGKRTQTHDAHDRYANQEISYLLQRIEDYDGLVILATNMKNNMDDAFLRRFQSIIYFPIPSKEERQQIWKNGFSPKMQPAPEVDISVIAEKHELSGAQIMNIIYHTTLSSLAKKMKSISGHDLKDGIALELGKQGRTL